MLQKIWKRVSAGLLAYLILSGIGMTACKKDEQTSVNTVQLEVFGPSPVLRGGEIKFIGKNLNKVTSIVLAEGQEITEITVVSPEEIWITIPQSAEPGHLTLKYAGGEIRTKTPLTFSEPISIDEVSPLNAKAGDVLTIEGEYLNLIAQVIFTQDAAVDSMEFVSHSREKIEVIVPRSAQSGKISISNGAEIPILIYSEQDVDVTLPTVMSIAPNPVKSGHSLTIKGTDFQLVESILFPEDVVVDEFEVDESFTEISVDVPSVAKEGHVRLVTYSGIEVMSEELALLTPVVKAVNPNPVKNGATLKIEGTDLDLVTSVIFEGDAEGEIISQSNTALEVNVPMTAKDGDLRLHTAAEKTTRVEVSLVKPTVTALNPTSLMAGETVTITGTHLDLAHSVVFEGGHETQQLTAISATSLRVDVPLEAESGVVKLVTVNGTEVISSAPLTVATPNIPIITGIPSSAKPGDLIRIEGSRLHLVESVYFQDNIKATQYGSRSENLIEVYIPENAAKGSVRLKLVTFDGREVGSGTFTISGVDPVTDPSFVFFDFDGKDSWWGSYGSVENLPDLSISGNYFRVNTNLPGGWNDFFWRNSRSDFKTDGVTVADWAIKIDVNVLGGATPELKFRLAGSDGDFWAIIPRLQNQGRWYTVTVPLTDFRDEDGTGNNRLPNVQNIDQDFGMATNGAAGSINICIDNVRFEKIN